MERATRILDLVTALAICSAAAYVLMTFSTVLSAGAMVTLGGVGILYLSIHVYSMDWLVARRLPVDENG